jgi:hypothetical protein
VSCKYSIYLLVLPKQFECSFIICIPTDPIERHAPIHCQRASLPSVV